MPVDKFFSYLLPHTPVNITSCRHACTSHLTFASAPTPGPGPVSKPADILPLTGADGSFSRSTRWQGAKCRKDYKIERSFLWVVRPVSWGRPSLLIISPTPQPPCYHVWTVGGGRRERERILKQTGVHTIWTSMYTGRHSFKTNVKSASQKYSWMLVCRRVGRWDQQ